MLALSSALAALLVAAPVNVIDVGGGNALTQFYYRILDQGTLATPGRDRVPQAVAGQEVRADVYWELPTGELALPVRNAAGFGPDGRGYVLLEPARQ